MYFGSAWVFTYCANRWGGHGDTPMTSEDLPFLPLPGHATIPRCWYRASCTLLTVIILPHAILCTRAGNSSAVVVSERGRACTYSDQNTSHVLNPTAAIACADSGIVPRELPLYYFEVHVRDLGR